MTMLVCLIAILSCAVTVAAQSNSSVTRPSETRIVARSNRPRQVTTATKVAVPAPPDTVCYSARAIYDKTLLSLRPRALSTQHSLDLWSVISGGFSSVGAKAEWRLLSQKGKLVPVALIIRYNASEDPESPNRITSYLAVAKITPSEICITDKIPPGPKANEDARRAADAASTKPCLKTP